MTPQRFLALSALVLCPISGYIAQAQSVASPATFWRPVPGAPAKEFRGSITGYQQVKYIIEAIPGQRLETRLNQPGMASLYHNVVAPSGATIFVGSSDGNQFQGILREQGRYEVMVYLMRNDARRGRRTAFTLRLRLTDGLGDRPGMSGPVRPSFDCRRANGAVEQAICSTASLSSLDARLDLVYQDALRGATGRRVEQIRMEQRAWVVERNTCAGQRNLTACIERKYMARLGKLEPKY